MHAPRPMRFTISLAALLLSTSCAIEPDSEIETGAHATHADTGAPFVTDLVGLYVDGSIEMTDARRLIRFDVASATEVSLVLLGATYTATLDDTAGFRFEINPSLAITGRLRANKTVEFDNPLRRTPTVAYLRALNQAPLTAEQVELGLALDRRIGQVAHVGQIELRVLPGYAIAVKNDDWTGRQRIDAVGAVRLDGTFYALDATGGNRISGRFSTDGTLQLTQMYFGSNAPEPLPSTRFEGELLPATPPGPLAIALWASANAWLKNARYPDNWARLTITSATTVLLDDWFGKVPLTVDANGYIAGKAKNGTEITGFVTRDGHVLLNGHTFTLRNDRPGPFTVLWDERNERCGSSTGNGWCELVPGSDNAAANSAALRWFTDRLGAARNAGILPWSLPNEFGPVAAAIEQLRARAVTPEQQPIKDAVLVDYAQLLVLRNQLAGGLMTSEALSFLEDNVYYYVRPLPVAEHDTAARAKLATVLAEHAGVTKGATNGSTTVARVTLLAPDRIAILLFDVQGVPPRFAEAPIAPDGAFGYRYPDGSIITGHVTPHGKVKLAYRFENLGPSRWLVDLLAP